MINSKVWAILSLFVMALVILSACTPQTPPASTPVPSTPVQTSVPTSNIPLPTSQDAAWTNIVKAAKQEGVVTIYSVAFVGDVGRRISQDFTNQTGIRTEILVGSGAILLEKIKVEQAMKRPVGDLWNSRSASSIAELVLLGGADSIAGGLPSLRDKAAFKIDPVYSPGGEAVVWAMGYGDAVINTKQIKPEDEPRSYKDLLSPTWKGKILTQDPRTSGGTIFYANLRYHKVLDLDYFTRLAQQDMAIWGGSATEGHMKIARGEFPMLLAGTTDIAAPIIAEGGPLKVLTPEDGNSAGLGAVVAMKGAPHPNAARVFVNWLLSQEGQRSYAEAASVTSIRKDVPDFTNPVARVTPKKIWARNWEMEEWARKDLAAKTMEKIFGSK